MRSHCDGTRVRVFWQPVDTATDYNLYYADEVQTTPGIEAQFDDADIGTDGWFHYTFMPEGSIVTVYLTALNMGLEESAASNTRVITLT